MAPTYIAGATIINPLNAIPAPPQGRLTLTTNAPVMTANVAAAANVLYTPYKGNRIPIWNGTNFEMVTFSELTNILANSAVGNAGPAAAVQNANYDFFVSMQGGTPVLSRGALWSKNAVVTTPVASPGLVNWTGHALVAGTPVSFSGGTLPTGIVAGTTYFVIAAGLTANAFEISATVGGGAINFTGSSSGTQTGVAGNDTARSTATENDLQVVQGIRTNLNAIVNGPAAGYGTYVGTCRTDSTGATVTWNLGGAASDGTQVATLYVWNLNDEQVNPMVFDVSAAWTYASSTYRAANNQAGNAINIVRGLDILPVNITYVCGMNTLAALATFGFISIGLDSVTASATKSTVGKVVADATSVATPQGEGGSPSAIFNGFPGLGKHTLTAIERGDNTNNVTFAGSPTMALAGSIRM